MARITWVDDGWVGLDRGIESDYYAEANAMLVTAYPLIFGLGSHGAAIHNLCLDGAKEDQEAGIGACRGSAIYFYQTDGITVENVIERSFMGEGIGFQMCAHTTVRHSVFNENAGNGLHPGAGSTIALLEDCTAVGNGGSGFFFCVRANHITVRRCDFEHNKEKGISIGKRDCYNLIQECHIHDNGGPGIGFRGDPKPVEEHSIRIEYCDIAHNCRTEGLGEIVLGDATHDIVLVNNHISGQTTGVYAPQGAERIYLHGNSFDGVSSEPSGSNAAWAEKEPSFAYGCDSTAPPDLRHLHGYLQQ